MAVVFEVAHSLTPPFSCTVNLYPYCCDALAMHGGFNWQVACVTFYANSSTGRFIGAKVTICLFFPSRFSPQVASWTRYQMFESLVVSSVGRVHNYWQMWPTVSFPVLRYHLEAGYVLSIRSTAYIKCVSVGMEGLTRAC